MLRLGVIGRIMLILLAALVAMVTINFGIAHLERQSLVPSPGRRFPRVVRAAGFIALIRNADPRLRAKIARLGSFGYTHVEIVDGMPRPAPDDIVAPHLAHEMLEVLGAAFPGLEVFTNTRMRHPGRFIEGELTKVLAPLGGGRTLVVAWEDPPQIVNLHFLGLIPALWAAILGIAVAALALASAAREIRPLRRLTEVISRFDGSAPKDTFDESGAPDVQRLVRAVREMQQRIATLLGQRTFLVGAISHDLRIYLTRLRLRAEAIADADARARLIDDLDGMSTLIDSSLAFARAATGPQTSRRIDLGDLVAVEVEEQAALSPRARLEGTYADGAIVAGDPVALRRVVANILDNALRFARSAVMVRVERSPTHERILIEDDGPGIPEAERRLVFEPFYRAETRARGSGTGLGLAIARQIVEAHGGTIEVGAATLQGAAFVVALPASRA